ncbi:MAG: sigma-70 family RNA polymerase sigma factor [Akkermansiaceae bacterium]|nr:sigma-70 family RNA polymerase sigma factor [Akkermansiaceae bacterium]
MDDSRELEYVKLLSDHQSMVRAYVISLMPGAPGVDDVIQEVNTVLWVKRGDFELGTSFRAWALAICRFQVMSHLRKLRQQRWVTLDPELIDQLADELDETIDAAREERRHKALKDCIGKLRDADRELLVERYWHKTRLQDFAVCTGRSVSALRVTLFRLRAGLKRCIEDKCGNLADPS